MKKIFLLFTLLFFVGVESAAAEDKNVLDLQIKNTIQRFEAQAKGGKEFLERTSGYLVIPSLYKAGFIVGGGYGEGGLVVGGKIVDYYSMISASIGFQAGAEKRSIIIAFLTPQALESFRQSNKWKVGIDGSIAFVNWGGGVDLSTVDFKKSIVAFAFDNKGIMANLSLDGAVFNKLKKP
ncbi:lipid-binding SYLF domain-containing protein [Nitratifractor sp.]